MFRIGGTRTMKYDCKPADRRSDLIVLYDPAEGISRTLTTSRKHLFAKDFQIEVVDDDTKTSPHPPPHEPTRPSWKSEISLVLMIIIIGIPVLLYNLV